MLVQDGKKWKLRTLNIVIIGEMEEILTNSCWNNQCSQSWQFSALLLNQIIQLASGTIELRNFFFSWLLKIPYIYVSFLQTRSTPSYQRVAYSSFPWTYIFLSISPMSGFTQTIFHINSILLIVFVKLWIRANICGQIRHDLRVQQN